MTAILKEKLERIVSGPADPDLDFTIGLHTYRDVYAMAEDMRSAFSSGVKSVLVCAEDKAVIAAAVLAALSSRFTLIFPYAVSGRVATEIRDSIGFDAVATDNPEIVPPDAECMVPSPKRGTTPPSKQVADPDAPFLKFFTGGSTGKPKIFSKTPNNVFGEAFYLAERFGLSKEDRILSPAPPYHIYGFLFSVLAPFVSSAGVLPKACAFPEEIRKSLRNDRPTVFAGVPMHYRILRDGDIPRGDLRLAVSSAGKLDEADGDAFHAKTGVELVEIYGSTETGGVASRCRAKGEKHLTPFETAEWKVSDERLLVRSPFISPEIDRDGEGYYRTGDRVEKIDDSSFSLIGRIDGVVKVAGKRVDLEEVRTKIANIAGVNDAAVFSKPCAGARESEVCAVVEGSITAKELKSMLRGLLEPYAVPRLVKVVEKLPVSASGKLDGKILRELFEI
jgi:acyl-coenzyme A synthetase/AMP-(fatty) acid ligase